MDRSKIGKAVMEAVGTAILVLTIQISVGGSAGAAAPVAIGLVLITIVYAGGPISGAHYNPAISLAIRLRGKMDVGDMIVYWISQVVGGYIGALLGGIVGGTFVVIAVGDGYSNVQAFLAEVIFTFVLCFVVLGTATHSGAENNSYYGVSIGGVVLVGAITVGPISGGAFNPAVALGLGLAKGLANMVYVLTTVLANLIGGALAAFVFYMTAPDQFDAVSATTGETTNLV